MSIKSVQSKQSDIRRIGSKVEEEEEDFRNFLKLIKCKSAEQNELEVQAQRIIYIFDKAVYKIRIVVSFLL